MKKAKIAQGIIMILVVAILLCGIFSIFRRVTGTQSASQSNDSDGSAKTTASAKDTDTASTTEKVDNSVPITSFTVTAEPSIREGQTMQLDIKYEPENATNTAIKWTISKENMVTISEDGILTAEEGSEKNEITVVGETTDGSELKQSFDLRIYPAIDTSKPMVAITFDDGPYDQTTPTMLDALEDNWAKATFFCLGQNTEYYPEIVQREYALGMQVATHTYSHAQLTTLSDSELEEEVSKAISAIENAIGVAPTLVRPPYGAYDDTVLASFKTHNLVGINWNLDTEDWKTKNADDTYKMVMTAQDGDIVLLHDIHDYNVKAVQNFVPDLIEKGYQLVTVSELYEAFGEELAVGTIHFRPDARTLDTESSTETTESDSTAEDLD